MEYALALGIAACVGYVLYEIGVLVQLLEAHFHIDDCIASAVGGMFCLSVHFLVRRTVHSTWLAYTTSSVFGYVAFRLHHEPAHRMFQRISLLVLLFYVADGPWRKKLWGRIKSAGLTAINAASFKRQSKQAFQ